jgi:hypothetical protein
MLFRRQKMSEEELELQRYETSLVPAVLIERGWLLMIAS